MTIVAAAIKNGRGAIAADTTESDGSFTVPARYLVNHSKILKCKSSLIGLSGWSATYDIFESIIRNHRKILDFSSRAAVFETGLALHKLMKDDYFIETQEDKEQPVESSQLSMLVANPHGIFEMESYRSVGQYTRYWAIGSGKPLAIGAMHAVFDKYKDAKDVVRAGVDAACEFDEGCMLPMEVRSFTLTTGVAKRRS